MKKTFLSVHLILLIFLLTMVVRSMAQVVAEKGYSKKPEGTAIIMTGAAARIPQEAALLEALDKKGMLNDVVFIAGASSGALNTVMLNAILEKKITWQQYKDILFNITNNNVYKQDSDKIPVDTRPLKKLLTTILHDKLGYYKIGDLPIPSAISITDIDLPRLIRRNYRLSNLRINPESDPSLDLVEILMASTAFPVVFPPVKISNAPTLPDDYFIDGGLVDDHIPYQGLLDFIKYRRQSVARVIIVSRKSNTHPELSEELQALGINDRGLMDKLGISLEDFLLSSFIKGLKKFQEKAPALAQRTLTYFPDFNQDFLLFDFNNLQLQYKTTSEWAAKHDPVPLQQFLKSEEDR